MILAIRDETAGGAVLNELTLDVLSETITVRELIRSRVYQEVQDHNLRQRQGAAACRGQSHHTNSVPNTMEAAT
jgi:hypothetical protein